MNWAYIIAAFVGGGGVAGLISVVIKVRPEANQVIVTSAQGAVVIQSTVIDDLNEQLDRVGKRLEAQEALSERLKKDLVECAGLHAENESQAQRIRDLEKENKALRRRVKHLEEEVAHLKGEPRPSRDRRSQSTEEEEP